MCWYAYLFIQFKLIEVEYRVDKEQNQKQSKRAVLQTMGADLYIVSVHPWLIGKVGGFDQPWDTKAEQDVEGAGTPGVAQCHGALPCEMRTN